MVRVAVLGASGRMGREICRAAIEDGEVELAGGTVRPGSEHLGTDLGELCGLGTAGVAATTDPPPADVLIDFSTPQATVSHLSYALPVVIGTTGLDEAQREQIERASGSVPIVVAPNTSVGINLLRGLVAEVTRKLGSDYDIEVVESHHRHKKDAPSGTALYLARAAAGSRGQRLEEVATYGREGHQPRRDGEIGVHSLRGGAVVGEHRVIFYSEGEEIELTHRALSRQTFARGAVRAAKFAASAAPGLYDMEAVLEG